MKQTVKLPAWWAESENVIGYTDAVTTYCASPSPCWYVEVPELDYSGYFKISDLEVIAK